MNNDPKKRKRYVVADNFLYEDARELFMHPKVMNDKKELEKLINFTPP
jgi:hypothetical protein